MGLDMYLHERLHMSKFFGSNGDNPRNQIKELAGLKSYPGNDIGSVEVHTTAMYWRKANAIHKWFVKNCQGGVDECQQTYVTVEQVQALLDLATEVQANHSLAPDKLNPQEGFFFGSTEIDQYYFQDIKDTVEGLTRVLADKHPDSDLYYQSSW